MHDLRITNASDLSHIRFKANVGQLTMNGTKPAIASGSMIEGVFDAVSELFTRFRQYVSPGH